MSASLEDLFGGQPPGEPDKDEGELRRAMVIAAHPDDADFGAGGTAALLAGAGWEVRYLVVTDGSKGSDDPAFTPESLVAAREREQREAARILGVGLGRLPWLHGRGARLPRASCWARSRARSAPSSRSPSTPTTRSR